ncbi:MAG: mannonate dehydratase [candidate division KSB1 bacterium]|nr:mannonate dehydratase [candidate division KSB1 bacterium]
MAMEKCWRWFGPGDPVTLSDMRQMGVEGVVTSLYDVPPGQVWPREQIKAVKTSIEQAGLRWSVVESLPVAEGIKQHTESYDELVDVYTQSLRHLGEQGIDTVCYNFMPALDWVRTDLHHRLPSGGEVMYFNPVKFAAFDLFILQRPAAEADYSEETIQQAESLYNKMHVSEREELAYNIIILTQGFIHGAIDSGEQYYREKFLELLTKYDEIDRARLRRHLGSFLNDVIPTAEQAGINLAIHPDDPPFPVLGLPRIVSTQDDLQWIFKQQTSLANGLTFCSGSLSVRRDNDPAAIAAAFAERIHFVHLRNNRVLKNGAFYESGHIQGDADLPQLIELILQEQHRRREQGRTDTRMPVRPDHGIKMLSDFNENTAPGYPRIGRLSGLMEIRGMEAALEYCF